VQRCKFDVAKHISLHLGATKYKGANSGVVEHMGMVCSLKQPWQVAKRRHNITAIITCEAHM